MNTAKDTYLLLWGGPVAPSQSKKVLYWAVNHEGTLCGIIFPSTVWDKITGIISTSAMAPYMSIAVTRLSSVNPEFRLITINSDALIDFCHLKNKVYQSRRTPSQLKLEPDKLMAHLGLGDVPSPAALNRREEKHKGDFFTLLPDKTRVELFYLVEENQSPPEKLDVIIMWGIKGFSLPHQSQSGSYKPAEYEKILLQRTEIKPQPLWLRRLLRIGHRRRKLS